MHVDETSRDDKKRSYKMKWALAILWLCATMAQQKHPSAFTHGHVWDDPACYEASNSSCAWRKGISCFGARVRTALAQNITGGPSLQLFHKPLLQALPHCGGLLLPLLCAHNVRPCIVDSEQKTQLYRFPTKHCHEMFDACRPLFALKPELKQQLPFDCNAAMFVNEGCEDTVTAQLPVLPSSVCFSGLLYKAAAAHGERPMFDHCYATCHLGHNASYVWLKFWGAAAIMLILLVFSGCLIYRSGVLKKSPVARLFAAGSLAALLYSAAWAYSSFDGVFDAVTCNWRSTRLTLGVVKEGFGLGSCTLLQLLLSSLHIACSACSMLTLLVSTIGTRADNTKNRLARRWVEALLQIEDRMWPGILGYCFVTPPFLIMLNGVERNEFSGVCFPGNYSTLAYISLIAASLLLVALVVLRPTVLAFSKSCCNSDAADAMMTPRGSYQHEYQMFGCLTKGVHLVGTLALLLSPILHYVFISGWLEQQDAAFNDYLRCLLDQGVNSPDCRLPANDLRAYLSLGLFTLLPVLVYIFAIFRDALPAVYPNVGWGVARWAPSLLANKYSTLSLEVETPGTRPRSRRGSKARELSSTEGSTESTYTDSTLPLRRGPPSQACQMVAPVRREARGEPDRETSPTDTDVPYEEDFMRVDGRLRERLAPGAEPAQDVLAEYGVEEQQPEDEGRIREAVDRIQQQHRYDDFAVHPDPMSSSMTPPEIQLRADVIRTVLSSSGEDPVFPLQILIILEAAYVVAPVSPQRPIPIGHVIYAPEVIRGLLGPHPPIPPSLRALPTFREHFSILGFQQALRIAAVFIRHGPPRQLPAILRDLNIDNIVPRELRDRVHGGDDVALGQALALVEASPLRIGRVPGDRVQEAFLYLRDYLDIRAAQLGLPPANANRAGHLPPQEDDSEDHAYASFD
ncbi:unnamed protein product, partial [Mesorhabditis spiculigera]